MKLPILLLCVLLGQSTWADEETRNAVREVQQEMKSPKFHEEAAKSSPEAKQVEQQVKELSGTAENEQAIYDLAAEVLGNMQDSSPDEMIKKMQEAQKNPEAFAKNWTPEQQRKLKELAERLPASQKRNP